jgi:hypothetical protein
MSENEKTVTDQNETEMSGSQAPIEEQIADIEVDENGGDGVEQSAEQGAATPQKDARYYEDRLRVIQGMLNKRNAEFAELKGMVSQLEKADQSQPKQATNRFSPKFREEYGEEFANEIASGVRSEFMDIIAQHKAEMEQMRQSVNRESNDAVFWLKVDKLCPGASDLQDDPPESFLAWLEQSVPMTGMSRKQIGINAVSRGDAATVAELFGSYMAAVGKASKTPADAVARQVMPAGSPARQTQSTAKKPTYTEAQIDKFWSDKMAGKYSGDPDKAQKIEAQIELAYKEGRVR